MPDNFGDRRAANGFQHNPQNINKSGANRKSFASINLQLKEKGIEPLSKTQLVEAYGLIFNSTEEELKVISTDKNTPYAMRLIILELNDKKARAKAMADYRDYMFGKAQQNTDITSKGNELKNLTTNDLQNMTIDELKKYAGGE